MASPATRSLCDTALPECDLSNVPLPLSFGSAPASATGRKSSRWHRALPSNKNFANTWPYSIVRAPYLSSARFPLENDGSIRATGPIACSILRRSSYGFCLPSSFLTVRWSIVSTLVIHLHDLWTRFLVQFSDTGSPNPSGTLIFHIFKFKVVQSNETHRLKATPSIKHVSHP